MRSPSNELLADKLREMADILEVQHEDGYRVAAYRRAARTLLELETPIDEIVRNEGLKGVVELPGIGRGIGTAIVEIVTTGRWNQLDRLSGTLEPEQLFQTVPGIGPQLAARIHNELNADTLPRVPIEATLKEALAELIDKRAERIVVLDADGAPVGTVSFTTLMCALGAES